ncbi:hypothetical protein L1D14_04120 [Vibrio tubiashii]|uniref:hypothetical protein n=1 Tax=Vibrio tubiashii TaxID=29498 RepID=UPI001EFE71DC|nr:hypothetical protein [Vibrio tubiashii]MCG9575417.1 hypothetical protein [Vibrio tubiashii]
MSEEQIDKLNGGVTEASDELVSLSGASLSMPVRGGHGGYDEQGNELVIEVCQLVVQLEDGRKYLHPTMGREDIVKHLKHQVCEKGVINLRHWHLLPEPKKHFHIK